MGRPDLLVINTMVTYRAIRSQGFEGTAVGKTPLEDLFYGIYTITLDVMLKNY